ncbi:MAG TPA: DinB family protein [Streptosporangiaceae bacterium]|jgi:hypothetical protein
MSGQRVTAPAIADERTTLTGFLDFQRATLERKCAGLTGSQLRERAVPPSRLCLLGIVRHMAEVERNWFRPVLEGAELATIFWPPLDWQRTFRDLEQASVAESFAVWRAECARARDLVAAATSLEVTGWRRGEQIGLRWVLTHMIEEYARHNGHADLIRECLDGSTGE